MGLTADDRLILIRVKIARARKHLRDLAAELLAVESRTIVIQPSWEPRAVPRLPFNALATAGDIIHNLRSALDHLAYQLVIVGSGKEPSRRVEFPIAIDCANYERAKVEKLDGVGPRAKKAIDDLKPYKGGNDTLWKIHDLDRIDKHRTLLTFAPDHLFCGDWCEDYLVRTDNPHFDEQVEQALQIEIDSAVSDGKVEKDNSPLPTLHDMVTFVEQLVFSFKPLLSENGEIGDAPRTTEAAALP